jgi:hypothetical protein
VSPETDDCLARSCAGWAWFVGGAVRGGCFGGLSVGLVRDTRDGLSYEHAVSGELLTVLPIP